MPSSIVVTNLGNEGPGTLRAAMAQADRHSGALTITFAPDLTGAIRLSAALPDLVTNINIVGPGPARLKVARNASHKTPQFRIFTIATGSSDTISGLTITGGSDSAGGGIENAGALVLKNDIISGNSATGTTKVPGTGGGVFNLGTLVFGGGLLNPRYANGREDDDPGQLGHTGLCVPWCGLGRRHLQLRLAGRPSFHRQWKHGDRGTGGP